MSAERHHTLAEVAEKFRFSDRKLRAIVRRHAIPVLRAGRDIRFDDIAYRALEEALRCHAPEDCGSPAVKIPVPSRSSVRLQGNAFESALQATTVASPKKKPRLSKQQSFERPGTASVVVLDRSGRR